MCGISGIYNFLNKDLDGKKIINKILKIQHERGPDNSNLWHSSCNKVYFGHNRLSIIDLSKDADQPFISNDRNYSITYNGEIYNYKSIKNELEKKNIFFKSKSDTEVILEAYKFWGIDFLSKLRGMFAFGIWDNLKKKLILARDPFGIKPLYYTKKNNIFYFASEIKSILSIDNLNFKKSEKGIVSYFLWGNVQEPFTLYKDIESVEKGTAKIIFDNGVEKIHQYASIKDEILNSKKAYFKNTADLNHKLKFFINDTVNHHQVADVPVTLLLSAGLDSSVILSSLNKDNKNKCSALTVDFHQNQNLNESNLAKISAKKNNMEHYTKIFDNEELANHTKNFFKRMDSPTNDGLNNYIISHFSKQKGSKVILSGIGGDEFFQGYPSFKRIPKMKFLPKTKIIGDLIFRILRPICNKININPKYAGIFKYGNNIAEAFFLQRSFMFKEDIKNIISPQTLRNGFDELNLFDNINNDLKDFEDIKLAIMYLEIKYYLSPKLLRDADWTSMSNSTELRTPFVDWFFFKQLLPLIKSNINVSKKNLFECFKMDLPNVLKNRKKTGFVIPHKYLYETIANKQVASSKILKEWTIFNYSQYLKYEK